MHLEGAYIRMYFLLFRSRLAHSVGVLYVEGLICKSDCLWYTLAGFNL